MIRKAENFSALKPCKLEAITAGGWAEFGYATVGTLCIEDYGRAEECVTIYA